MTNQQINYEIQQALSELDFSEHDFVHEITVLCEDVEVGMDSETAKNELAEIIENAQLGKVFVAQIIEHLTSAILSELT